MGSSRSQARESPRSSVPRASVIHTWAAMVVRQGAQVVEQGVAMQEAVEGWHAVPVDRLRLALAVGMVQRCRRSM